MSLIEHLKEFYENICQRGISKRYTPRPSMLFNPRDISRAGELKSSIEERYETLDDKLYYASKNHMISSGNPIGSLSKYCMESAYDKRFLQLALEYAVASRIQNALQSFVMECHEKGSIAGAVIMSHSEFDDIYDDYRKSGGKMGMRHYEVLLKKISGQIHQQPP